MMSVKFRNFAICLIVSSAIASTPSTELDEAGRSAFNLEHSLDDCRSFKPRGQITILTTRTGATTIDQEAMSDSDKESLNDLCESGGIYLLRLTSDSDVYRAGSDPCNLVKSGYRDAVTLHLDWRGKLVAFSHLATGLDAPQASRATSFITKVNVQPIEAGPQPDTTAFIQKIEQEKLAKQRGETKDNRSFFSKYWMYIIPVVLVMAMSSANPEGGGGR